MFILAERRAQEPIIPLRLFRLRTYSTSMISTFFAAFAFFGAIVFLPRWFQFVHGFTPTESGLAALPLMAGLIFSSIVSGLVVSRTGRYKWLVVGAIVLMAISSALMTQLTSTTPLPMVWFWMFLAGLGVGPTFAVFTIIIQNAVPFHDLGVATSNLTFFRQIGGSVSLAIVGTIFGTSFQEELVPSVAAAGVPQQVVDGFQQASSSGAFDVNQLAGAGVGSTSARRSWARSAAAQSFVAPFISDIVQGIYAAFSLGVAQTFYIAVGAAIVAAVAAAMMIEHPLRTSVAASPVVSPSSKPSTATLPISNAE